VQYYIESTIKGKKKVARAIFTCFIIFVSLLVELFFSLFPIISKMAMVLYQGPESVMDGLTESAGTSSNSAGAPKKFVGLANQGATW
jgi:hypothetical protein